MKKVHLSKYLYGILLVLCLAAFTGCDKETSYISENTQVTNDSDPVQATYEIVPDNTTAAEAIPTTAELEYEPGTLGSFVMANSQIQAEDDVLDNVTMSMPENMSREKVSNLQHDFVKDGMQVGGILLVDIPNDLLEAAVESYEDTEELADYLAKQVMSDAYPSKITFSGGGESNNYDFYIRLSYYNPDILSRRYIHHIYVGESYCYDVWIDATWHPDVGGLILSTLSSPDIKPELNSPEYHWDIVEGELVTW